MSAANPVSYEDIGQEERSKPHIRAAIVEQFLEAQRRRLILFAPAAIGIGIMIWYSFGPSGYWQCAAISLALIAGGALCAGGSYTRMVMISAGLLVALGFCAISIRSAWVAPEMLDRPWVGRLYARVINVEDNVALSKQRLLLATDGRQGLPDKIRVSRPLEVDARSQKSESFRTGDVIAVKARLMPPAAPAFPGAYDFAERAWFDGLGATGSALGEVRLIKRADDGDMLGHWRQLLSQHVRRSIGGDAGAIAATLATGDRSGISQESAEDMRRSGMAHLLSISGLHVTAIVGAVFIIVLRSLAVSPRLALRWNLPVIAAVAGALAAIFYTILTGAAVPTIRSCIAALFILGAMAMGRDPISLRLIAAGATIIMLFLPESVVGPSFQLSFAAVTAIIALHDSAPMRKLREKGHGFLRSFGRGLLMLFLTGLAVEAVLSPIALYHFHETGLYGAIANIFAIPLTTFAVMPLLALALFADLFGIGGPFWWLAGNSIDLLLWIAARAAHAPGAHVVTSVMSDSAFCLYMAGLILLFFLKGRARFFGVSLSVAGFAWMLSASPPDILIDGSGRHIVLKGEGDRYFVARDSGGDFVRDLIAEQMGTDTAPDMIDRLQGARCSVDACILDMPGHDASRENLRLLVTRSSRWLDYEQMIATCAVVDIVVSDRMLPKACSPKWLKADKSMLRQAGGLAIRFEDRQIRTVAEDRAQLPWDERYSPR